jgi:outer membrane protein assembly factor BamB
MGSISDEDGVFLFSSTQTRKWYGYSLTSGQLLWTTPSIESWDYYGMSGNVYDGKLLAYGYGGVLHAFDMKTGKELWTYTATGVGFESPYGNYPLSMGAIADGKIYLYSTEHSPTMPLWRGSYIRCVDAKTGHEDWKISNWANNIAIADGYLVSLNLYDNRIYTYGKGPSDITIAAPDNAAPLGTPVVIKGFVTDQSPGAKDTPAISDTDMQAWMEYLYQQQVYPTNAKGVTVHLTAIDPNGNYQDIGNATSDTSGFYSIMWTPPVTGKYIVTATFEGSNGYYPSSAKSAFAVSSAAVNPIVTAKPTPGQTQTTIPTQPPTTTIAPSPSSNVQPPTSQMPAATYLAVGAVVIIVLVAAATLVLRRRK